MMRRSAWWAFALMASCQSTAPTDGGRGDAGDAGDVPCRSADEFAQSHQPNDPCAVDSDCHNAFLACVAQDVFICRDPNMTAADAGCPSPIPASAPICPTTAQVSIHMCTIRYQQPCQADADCGPGFACIGHQCLWPEAILCETPADCPSGWECYVSCPCVGALKRCYAPFATFNCPLCPPSSPNDAGADDAGADGAMAAD